MKKREPIQASVSAALVCAAVPVSFNWSPANVTLFSLDTAEARVGRPLTATSVAGVSRRVNRREYGARQQELRLELPLSEALLLGRMSGDLPRPTGPDLRSP